MENLVGSLLNKYKRKNKKRLCIKRFLSQLDNSFMITTVVNLGEMLVLREEDNPLEHVQYVYSLKSKPIKFLLT